MYNIVTIKFDQWIGKTQLKHTEGNDISIVMY